METVHVETRSAHSRPWSAFIPLLILLVTYLVWTVFQTTQLMRERDALAGVHVNQDKQMQDSKKLRERLDKVSRETQLLANRGNKGALFVVEELRKRGITINPEGPVLSMPGAPAATGSGK